MEDQEDCLMVTDSSPEPSLREVLASVKDVLGKVSEMTVTMPKIIERVDSNAARIDVLEQQMRRLEHCGAPSCVSGASGALSYPPGLAAVTSEEDLVWLSGGWPDKTTASSVKDALLAQFPMIIDAWVTSNGERTMLFVKTSSQSDRGVVHSKVMAEVRKSENLKGVWAKNGRTAVENKAIAKAKCVFELVRKKLLEKGVPEPVIKEKLLLRTREALVVYDSRRLCRFQHGKERYDWSAIHEVADYERQQLLDAVLAIDEMP
eukprot:2639191-Amphidinium_carterae.2